MSLLKSLFFSDINLILTLFSENVFKVVQVLFWKRWSRRRKDPCPQDRAARVVSTNSKNAWL